MRGMAATWKGKIAACGARRDLCCAMYMRQSNHDSAQLERKVHSVCHERERERERVVCVVSFMEGAAFERPDHLGRQQAPKAVVMIRRLLEIFGNPASGAEALDNCGCNNDMHQLCRFVGSSLGTPGLAILAAMAPTADRKWPLERQAGGLVDYYWMAAHHRVGLWQSVCGSPSATTE